MSQNESQERDLMYEVSGICDTMNENHRRVFYV